MKKTIYILFISMVALSACHPNKTNTNPAASSPTNPALVDTSKMHAIQQAADTSIKKDGKVIKRYANGVIKENDYYAGGRRQGECQSFYPSGKLESDCYFTSGIADGACTTYYESGEKRYEGQFSKGKPSGTWNFFDEKGKPQRTIKYGKSGDKTVM